MDGFKSTLNSVGNEVAEGKKSRNSLSLKDEGQDLFFAVLGLISAIQPVENEACGISLGVSLRLF